MSAPICCQILCPRAATVEVQLADSALPYTACVDHIDDVAWGSPITSVRPIPAPAAEPTSPYRIATVPVPTQYRPSKWSSPWILLLPLLGWELWTVAKGKAGGPLSHLVWWSYGPRYSLRWFLMSMGMNALGVWAAAHFMFERWEVRELGICVGLGLLLGLLGWLFLAVKW